MAEENHVDVERFDDLELEAGGYRREMPRRFSLLSMMSLSFALTCTWSGTGSSIGISLTEASSVGTIWSLPIAGCMTTIVSLGIAELASAYPVAGAQYYWSFMVSSDKHRAFAAYINGWLSILGWWLASASVCNFIASMALSIVIMWIPSYTIQHWHQWLIYVAIAWLTVVLNVFGSRWIPMFNKFIMVLAVCSLTATTSTLLVCSIHHRPSAAWVFKDTTNSTGWKSDGFAFILAIGNAVYAFLGTDAGAHLCEEIHNPSKNVPKVILYPIGIGLVTAFPFACACMASIIDINAVLGTATGLPLIEIYYQSTGSKAAATTLIVAFALCFFGCMAANGTTSSRTLWAVSRDGALPFSHMWMRVNHRFKMPLNAMCLSGTVISLYGLIFLGSTTAFSAMVGAAIIFLQTSCIVPQAILLYRGRDKVLPERYFSLGRFGTLVNVTAILWVVFLDVIYCLPTERPVTKENMNYVSVVSTGLATFVVGLWFITKKTTFRGPKIDLEELQQRRHEALHIVTAISSPDRSPDSSQDKSKK